MKKRKDIADIYKWNFDDYFKSDEEWNKEYKKFSEDIQNIKKFYGKLTNKKDILACFKILEDIEIKAQALYIYAYCLLDLDVTNPKYQGLLNKIKQKLTEKYEIFSFIGPQLSILDEDFLDELLADAKFAAYTKILREIKREKKYILSEESEKLLSSMSAFSDIFSSNFSNFQDGDLKFQNIRDKNGKEFKMNNSLSLLYLQNPDSVLRENSYKELQNAYGRFNNFLSSNYLGSVKKDVFFAKARNFTNSISKALFYEEVDEKVYRNLISSVEKHLHLNHKYFEIRQKLFNLKTFKISDIFFSPLKLKTKYSYEQALNIVYSALEILGEDYVSHIKHMVKNKMIDVFPAQNKTNGAYLIMSAKKSPRVLLNFMGTFNDVSTLAHELGHAMHSVFSDESQSVFNAEYTIFLAEIASTVNELLLDDYMLKNAKTIDEKIYFINQFLSKVYSTIFRQIMFASFEEKIHAKVENNEELSTVILNETYLQLVKKYFGKKVKIFDEMKFEWSRIPHFYGGFYVYKYATGLISAINIVTNLTSGKISVSAYKKFLSAGCTDTPTELLKIVKVNFDNEEPFKKAFSYIEEKLNQLNILEKDRKL